MNDFFQRYLQTNTAQPNPDYQAAINCLADQAQLDQLPYKVHVLPSGFPVFLICIEGSDKNSQALLLNHHIDVVPANPKVWKHHPFSATRENGKLYARGTQDMKGVGLVHYAGLRKVLSSGKQPKRSIHFMAVPDEEVGGFGGTAQIIEQDWFKALNVGYILDEGVPSGDQKTLYIKVSERKPLHLLFHVAGTQGHASRILADNPASELVRFLQRIVELHDEQKAQTASIHAGNLLSLNLTSLTSGVINNGSIAYNMVPGTAQASVDVRVPPSMKINEAMQAVEKLVAPFPLIRYEIVSRGLDFVQPVAGEQAFCSILTDVIKNHGFGVKNWHAEESSDLRFYRSRGIAGLGLTPFTAKENLHGVDEYIYEKDLEHGTLIFADILQKFCF